MAIEWDPILFINLILCIIIVILGFFCWSKTGKNLPLFIAAAFGLFGISHAVTLAGLKNPLTIPLIIIRVLAYLLVIFALFQHLKDSMTANETRQAWVDYFKGETGDAGGEKKV
jgi:hypothetical protein